MDPDAAGVSGADWRRSTTTLSPRLPESLHRQFKAVAEPEGVSINPFIATAVAEKMSALITAEYLEERAARGDRARLDSVRARVRDQPVEDDDRIAGDSSSP